MSSDNRCKQHNSYTASHNNDSAATEIDKNENDNKYNEKERAQNG